MDWIDVDTRLESISVAFRGHDLVSVPVAEYKRRRDAGKFRSGRLVIAIREPRKSTQREQGMNTDQKSGIQAR